VSFVVAWPLTLYCCIIRWFIVEFAATVTPWDENSHLNSIPHVAEDEDPNSTCTEQIVHSARVSVGLELSHCERSNQQSNVHMSFTGKWRHKFLWNGICDVGASAC
jgi:hypothetical protein